MLRTPSLAPRPSPLAPGTQPSASRARQDVSAHGVAGQPSGVHCSKHITGSRARDRASPGTLDDAGGVLLLALVLCAPGSFLALLVLERLALSVRLASDGLPCACRRFRSDSISAESCCAPARTGALRRRSRPDLLFLAVLFDGPWRGQKRARRHS